MAEESLVTTQEEEAPQEEGVQLGLNELAGAIKIIDVCSERGAFKGPELEEVGRLRGRLAQFIDANAPKQEETPGEGSEPETTTDAP
jgi:hypothetical protein